MKYLFPFVLLLTFAFFSCNEEAKQDEKIEKYVAKKAGDNQSESDHMSMATIWFQKSAENRAVYYQTFALAKMMFDKNAGEIKTKKPLAVITDIDETVLDNSPYNAGLIEKGTNYGKESWKTWVREERAKALPGALDFCNYVREQGVEVFYVSNRHNDDVEATIQNLVEAGFPFADKEHVILKTESSDKTERRAKVSETHEVILFLGDNLRDFDEVFGGRGEDLGFKAVDDHMKSFGTKFIVFPNPIYGEWEKAVYKGDFSIADDEKRQMRLDILDK